MIRPHVPLLVAFLAAATPTAAQPGTGPLPGAAPGADNTVPTTPRVRGTPPAPTPTTTPSASGGGWQWPWGTNPTTGSSSGASTTTTTAPTSVNYPDYVRQHGDGVDASAGPYPVCAVQRSMNEDGLICLAGSGWLALTQTLPPQLGWGSEVRAPVDPNNELPKALAGVGKPLPAIVPAAQSDAERPTYYWYYRAIQNLYASMNARAGLDLALPAAWTHQKAFVLERGQGPFAVTSVRGDEMVVVIRGTVYPGEWQRDFQYAHAPAADVAPYGFPGNVHAGFFAVFKALAKALVDDEVVGRKPTRVTFTGHSLGGSVGALLAYYATQKLPATTTVELVSFGAPNVGDAAFVAAFNEKVNNRHLTFTGVGAQGDSYHMGDWISQAPCGAVTTCPLLNDMSGVDRVTSSSTEAETSSYSYTALGGAVPFTSAQLNNSATWALRSDVTSLRYSPVASHVCSYQCFTAPSVGDPDDKCVFTLEMGSSVDMEYRCAINM